MRHSLKKWNWLWAVATILASIWGFCCSSDPRAAVAGIDAQVSTEGGSGGSGSDGNTTRDAGVDADLVNHLIQCGSAGDAGPAPYCDNRTQVCCRNSQATAESDGGSWGFRCAQTGACTEDVAQSCNSAANCASGQVCVLGAHPDGGPTPFLCVPGPVDPTQTEQACVITAECAPGTACSMLHGVQGGTPLDYLGGCYRTN